MRFVNELERRAEARRRESIPCKLLFEGKTCAAKLRNFSARVVYVEAEDELPPSAGIVLSFCASDGARFVLEAVAPRRAHATPRSLAGLTIPGCALMILNPPPAYLHWVQEGMSGLPVHAPPSRASQRTVCRSTPLRGPAGSV
jgi:hypothetical protein